MTPTLEAGVEIDQPGTWSDEQDERDRQRHAALERLDKYATWLDAEWRIAFTRIRFGVDPLISLVPVAGDAVAGLMSAYLVHQAARHGAPRRLIMRMMMNVGVDFIFGSVPIVGTIFDVAFKASKRNARLLREYLHETDAPASMRPAARTDDETRFVGERRLNSPFTAGYDQDHDSRTVIFRSVARSHAMAVSNKQFSIWVACMVASLSAALAAASAMQATQEPAQCEFANSSGGAVTAWA